MEGEEIMRAKEEESLLFSRETRTADTKDSLFAAGHSPPTSTFIAVNRKL